MDEKTERRLIVVSNRLPFQLLEKKNKITLKESDGGLVSALKSYFEGQEGQQSTISSKWWIGSAEFPETRWAKFKAKGKQAGAFEVEPIFIDTKTYSKYYNGFYNATL